MVSRWSKSIFLLLGFIGAVKVEAQTSQTLEVYGEGRVEVVPDMAYVQVGVTTVGEHIEKASVENARAVEAVFSAVEITGVDPVDIKTGNFSIGAERNYREDKDRAVYRVNNMVDITVRDLFLVSQVLGAAMRSGANEVRGLRMEVAQKRKAMVEARSLRRKRCTAKGRTSGFFARSPNRSRAGNQRGRTGRAGSSRQGDGHGCAIGADKRGDTALECEDTRRLSTAVGSFRGFSL